MCRVVRAHRANASSASSFAFEFERARRQSSERHRARANGRVLESRSVAAARASFTRHQSGRDDTRASFTRHQSGPSFTRHQSGRDTTAVAATRGASARRRATMARDDDDDDDARASIARAKEALDALARGELRARATATARGARAVEHFEKTRTRGGGDEGGATTRTRDDGARDGGEGIAPRALVCVFERPRRARDERDGSESESESEARRDGGDDGGRGVRDASGNSTVDARFERRGGG